VTPVVAVHGAFRGAWSWDRVRPFVEAAGHALHAPDLTGMGQSRLPTTSLVTLDDWIADVVAAFDALGLDDATLVGHSMGGVVCQAALAALDGRVRALVLLDSPLVEPGRRAVDASSSDPVRDDLLPPPETWIPATPVGPEQGFDDPDLAAWVDERLCPTPFAPQLDPLPPRPAVPPPTTIVFCEHTPPAFPSAVSRARCDADGTPYVTIDSHHDAPLLAPDLVARLLTA